MKKPLLMFGHETYEENSWTGGSTVRNMTLEGGSFGIRIPINTAGWLIRNVRFSKQEAAGFAADSFDNGNSLIECEFAGGRYGFVGGGWNRKFIDKGLLWQCRFTGQQENGISLGDRAGRDLIMHVTIRDCEISDSGGSGLVGNVHGYRPSVIDHCTFLRCGKEKGSPAILMGRGAGSGVGIYHTKIEDGAPKAPAIDARTYVLLLCRNLSIAGGNGQSPAVLTDAEVAWLDNIKAAGECVVEKAKIVLQENCKWNEKKVPLELTVTP
jgi:hypothetical protein